MVAIRKVYRKVRTDNIQRVTIAIQNINLTLEFDGFFTIIRYLTAIAVGA